MSNLEVRVSGLRELVRQVNDPALTDEPMLGFFRSATEVAHRGAAGAAPAGAIRGSLLTEATPALGRVYSNLLPAKFADGGRRPGAKLPPVDFVERWANARGIDASPFAIARAIARRGIRGRFFMRAGRRAVREAAPALLRTAAERIAARWGAQR